MFTALPFTIAKAWKQLECPSMEEWIKKMWHMDTIEHYSVIKRNEIVSLQETQVDLDPVIHSEVSETEKKTKKTYFNNGWNLEKLYRPYLKT